MLIDQVPAVDDGFDTKRDAIFPQIDPKKNGGKLISFLSTLLIAAATGVSWVTGGFISPCELLLFCRRFLLIHNSQQIILIKCESLWDCNRWIMIFYTDIMDSKFCFPHQPLCRRRILL